MRRIIVLLLCTLLACYRVGSALAPVINVRSPLFCASTQTTTLQRRPSLLYRCAREAYNSAIRSKPKRRRPSSSSRRRAVVAATALALATGVVHPLPAHAESAAPISERLLEKTSADVDTIIDRYVQKHMFDDAVDDPISSLYKEAYQDATTGEYPAALREVASDVLGNRATAVQKDKSKNVGYVLLSIVRLLQQRVGLSETAATAVLVSLLVLSGPTLFLFGGMVIGGISKRNMNSLFKKRYGDTYTVDATIKPDEEVEAPDDEDEDDDDEGDDDGDDVE